MKESRGFMSSLNGMFNCAFGILEGNNHVINVWKRALTLLWEFWKENGILRTSMGAMGKFCFYYSIQFLFVPLSNF